MIVSSLESSESFEAGSEGVSVVLIKRRVYSVLEVTVSVDLLFDLLCKLGPDSRFNLEVKTFIDSRDGFSDGIEGVELRSHL